MKKCNVLFGFDSPEFSNGVINSLKRLGCEVNYEIRLSKTSIRDFLKANPDFDTVVLLEVVNRPGSNRVEKYSADELAWLTDERDINVIVVLSATYRATDYMKVLYQAGITSALYQKGRKGGATVQEIAKLCLRKRSRKEALDYYGIDRKPLQFSSLEKDDFDKKMEELMNEQYGESLIERFIYICNTLSQKQTASFIQKLPQEILGELKRYDEFYIIVNFLKKVGIDLKIKRPKNVSIGLVKPDGVAMLEVSGAAPKLAAAQSSVIRSADDYMLDELYASAEPHNSTLADSDSSNPLDEKREESVVDVGNMFFDMDEQQNLGQQATVLPGTQETHEMLMNRTPVEENGEIEEEMMETNNTLQKEEKAKVIDLSGFFGEVPIEDEGILMEPVAPPVPQNNKCAEPSSIQGNFEKPKTTVDTAGEMDAMNKAKNEEVMESVLRTGVKTEDAVDYAKQMQYSEPGGYSETNESIRTAATYGSIPESVNAQQMFPPKKEMTSLEKEMLEAYMEKKIREGIEQEMRAKGLSPQAVQGSPQTPDTQRIPKEPKKTKKKAAPAQNVGTTARRIAPMICGVVMAICFVTIIYINFFM